MTEEEAREQMQAFVMRHIMGFGLEATREWLDSDYLKPDIENMVDELGVDHTGVYTKHGLIDLIITTAQGW